MTITSLGTVISTLPITVPAESTPIVSPGPIGPQGATGATGATGPSGITTPGGRLTLSSSVPVMNTTVTAASSIFYTPFVHNFVPIYNGSALFLYPFTQTSVTLDTANVASGNIYDLFVWNNGGVPTLGYGPAWTNTTTRSATLTQSPGIWVNNAQITLRMSNVSTQVVAAFQATYLGTFYATANGQTGMALAVSVIGGGGNVLALYNFYNRERIIAYSSDLTGNWSYSSTTWRKANNKATNSISYVDGMATCIVHAMYAVFSDGNGNTDAGFVGIALDWVSGAPAFSAYNPQYGVSGPPVDASRGSAPVIGLFLPTLGFHVVNALESTADGGTNTYYGTQAGFGATPALGVANQVSVELFM